jgi:hypothetical protein
MGGVACGERRANNRAGVRVQSGLRLADQGVLDRAATTAMYMREAVIDDRLREGDLLASQGDARYDDPVQCSADHPDCCRIVAPEGLRAEEQPPNWARIAGAFRADVLVSYDVAIPTSGRSGFSSPTTAVASRPASWIECATA